MLKRLNLQGERWVLDGIGACKIRREWEDEDTRNGKIRKGYSLLRLVINDVRSLF